VPLPDFFIAGVPKAGTTALYAALTRHPDLFLPTVKEPKFFLSDGPPPRHGGPGDIQTYGEHVWRREEYEALFAPAPPGALRGEATRGQQAGRGQQHGYPRSHRVSPHLIRYGMFTVTAPVGHRAAHGPQYQHSSTCMYALPLAGLIARESSGHTSTHSVQPRCTGSRRS
jgi:hypothetical protein